MLQCGENMVAFNFFKHLPVANILSSRYAAVKSRRDTSAPAIGCSFNSSDSLPAGCRQRIRYRLLSASLQLTKCRHQFLMLQDHSGLYGDFLDSSFSQWKCASLTRDLDTLFTTHPPCPNARSGWAALISPAEFLPGMSRRRFRSTKVQNTLAAARPLISGWSAPSRRP